MILRSLSLSIALAGALLATAARAELPPVTIVSGAVSVDAVFADSVVPNRPPEIRLEIHAGDACWQTTTSPFGMHDTAETLAHHERVIGWKGRYLFVRTECGGGNAWKCDQELVFARQGPRLAMLGRLAPSADGIGTSYRDGRFYDMDVDWELNDVTSHAGAPAFPLVLRDAGGRLVVDLDASWKAAEAGYRQNQSAVQALRDSTPTPDVVITRRDLLFGNAVTAAYFRRPAELVETLAEARRTVDPATYAMFEQTVDAVHPGALPEATRLVLRRCGEDEE